ncbi:ent-kaurenoic acid oxidase 1-like [Corylus avellana]|uniref:ent-kaurenoic acid oxidase 1-like n=1 Tax=Corylus avellana TaxID=13451 RepID=UPI00286C6376|nr:ent-kaurenoic acid oxidase 1-like [Corylus avellana]
MEMTVGVKLWLGLFIGGLPRLGWLLWWWNELWYVAPLQARCSATGTNLPPGHMGFPLLGEMLTFLWYFKILRRPNEFINSKRRKYGDGVGMYRTHLFGSPSIIACFPSINKFIFQSDDKFILKWPQVDLTGPASLVAVHGKSHARLRSYILNAINRPDALRRIDLHVQPRMVAARAPIVGAEGLQNTKGLESDCVDSIYLHTNPENFEDPMCFNPDRWNEPARPGTYQVFGGGSRICAGNMLARIELALFLHHLSVGYKWELLNPDVEMVYLPHPIPPLFHIQYRLR